jgi:broad specificity phosphatase PhoE
VRHAHAGDKRNWTGPDLERPLSGTGRREAHGLLTRLRDYDITRILSSPTVRRLQTVEPLAARRGLTLETTEVLGVGVSRPDCWSCCKTRAQGSCWYAANA